METLTEQHQLQVVLPQLTALLNIADASHDEARKENAKQFFKLLNDYLLSDKSEFLIFLGITIVEYQQNVRSYIADEYAMYYLKSDDGKITIIEGVYKTANDETTEHCYDLSSDDIVERIPYYRLRCLMHHILRKLPEAFH